MKNSTVIFIFLCFRSEVHFFFEICSKNQNCLLKLKFRIYINLNMLNSMVIFIFLGSEILILCWFYQKIQKSHFKTKFGTYSQVPCLIDIPPLIDFSIFFPPRTFFFHPPPPPLINYWGKFSTRVWNDILMLTFFAKGVTHL